MFHKLFPNIILNYTEFSQSIIDTMIMLAITGVFSFIFGMMLGIILVLTRKNGLMENKVVYIIISKFIDLFRAIPFIILIMVLSPLTRAIMGTTIQLKGAILPLIFGITPFFARQIEGVLLQIDGGVIEASKAMGCTTKEIVFGVYLRESVSSIIHAMTITLTSAIGYIAMVGIIGGGGIGDFCIRYGYYGYKNDVIFACVFVLLIITTTIQIIGNYFAKKLKH